MKPLAAGLALQPWQLAVTGRHNAVANEAFFYTLKLLLHIPLPKSDSLCNTAILVGQEGCDRQQPLSQFALRHSYLQQRIACSQHVFKGT